MVYSIILVSKKCSGTEYDKQMHFFFENALIKRLLEITDCTIVYLEIVLIPLSGAGVHTPSHPRIYHNYCK